jgi:competence protein ComGC
VAVPRITGLGFCQLQRDDLAQEGEHAKVKLAAGQVEAYKGLADTDEREALTC